MEYSVLLAFALDMSLFSAEKSLVVSFAEQESIRLFLRKIFTHGCSFQ